MAVNSSRSQRMALLEGTTDGKYRKIRPDTEVVPGTGHEQTMSDRASLHAPMNYGYIASQIPASQQISPGV